MEADNAARADTQGKVGKGKNGKQSGIRKGGRPVTWIGGGGMDTKKLSNLGVPQLRALFLEVFGQHTASNNATWLRRKLSEPPDAMYGRGRSALVRARDVGAAIWTTGSIRNITKAEEDVTVGPAPNKVIHMASGSHSEEHSSQTAEDHPTNSCRGSGAEDSHDSLASKASRRRPNRRSEVARLMQGQEAINSGEVRRAKRAQQEAPQDVERHPLSLEAVGPHLVGREVHVYWPEDGTWWPATVTRINVAQLKMRLLYENGEDETISGMDFVDMLRRGHVAVLELAAGAGMEAMYAGEGEEEAVEAQMEKAASEALPGGWGCAMDLERIGSSNCGRGVDVRVERGGEEEDDEEMLMEGSDEELEAQAFEELVQAVDRSGQMAAAAGAALPGRKAEADLEDMGAELELLGGRDWQNYQDPLLANWQEDDMCDEDDWMSALPASTTSALPTTAEATAASAPTLRPTLQAPMPTPAPAPIPVAMPTNPLPTLVPPPIAPLSQPMLNAFTAQQLQLCQQQQTSLPQPQLQTLPQLQPLPLPQTLFPNPPCSFLPRSDTSCPPLSMPMSMPMPLPTTLDQATAMAAWRQQESNAAFMKQAWAYGAAFNPYLAATQEMYANTYGRQPIQQPTGECANSFTWANGAQTALCESHRPFLEV